MNDVVDIAQRLSFSKEYDLLNQSKERIKIQFPELKPSQLRVEE
jgi:hypothetical protein